MYKKINFNDIRHPETQQELQENIKRHFMCVIDDNNEKLCLAVWGRIDENAKDAGMPYMLPLEDINSWDDVYKFAREQDKLYGIEKEQVTFGDGTTIDKPTCPSIAPNIDFDMQEVTDFWFNKKSGDYLDAIKMYEPVYITDVFPEYNVLSREQKIAKIVELDNLAEDENSLYEDFRPSLYKLDNQILREFYAKTWGEFNFYSYYERKAA
jgi:hypothetical protein